MPTIIPTPAHVEWGHGSFLLPSPLPVRGGGVPAEVLAERLSRSAGVQVLADGVGAGVDFIEDTSLPDEGYRLSVSADGVRIWYSARAGASWAVQTLLQLLPREVHTTGPMDPAALIVPFVEITDEPALAWRGSMVDVARHFLPLDGLLRHLDVMAMHKLNVLHLHLTDDQGWRFPVPGWPKLTEVGAWRPGTLVGHQPPPDENDCDDVAEHDSIPHGGFYTAEEIGRLVEHANRLGITVVPEVDMPGHMEAAVAAYPELGASGVQHPRTCWGISEHVLRLDDTVIQFCKDALDAVMDLFPGSPVHVGGDECPGSEWLADERSQATMRREGLSTPAEGQAWFERIVCEHVLARGRRVIAWDEVLEGGVPDDVTIMVWRDAAQVGDVISKGYDVLAAPTQYTYLDYCQGKWDDHPLNYGQYTPLEKTQGFAQMLGALPDGPGRLLGGQFQLWGEYVRDWAKAEYMTWPRGTALAQQFWAGSAASERELGALLRRLTVMGINWCREGMAWTSEQ